MVCPNSTHPTRVVSHASTDRTLCCFASVILGPPNIVRCWGGYNFEILFPYRQYNSTLTQWKYLYLFSSLLCTRIMINYQIDHTRQNSKVNILHLNLVWLWSSVQQFAGSIPASGLGVCSGLESTLNIRTRSN